MQQKCFIHFYLNNIFFKYSSLGLAFGTVQRMYWGNIDIMIITYFFIHANKV